MPQSIPFDSVADLYDSSVCVDFDIPFWLSELGQIDGHVLELTSGTGRVSLPLLKAGVKLTCVDYAPAMLKQLRCKIEEQRLSCPIYCQNMAELELPARYDAIIIPFHSFSEVIDRTAQQRALKRIQAHLTPDGIFICTLQNPIVRTASMDGAWHLLGEFPMSDGGTLTVHSRLTFNPSTQLASGEQFYERRDCDTVPVDRRSLPLCFYLFTAAEFEELVQQQGFVIQARYGNYQKELFDEEISPFMIYQLAAARH